MPQTTLSKLKEQRAAIDARIQAAEGRLKKQTRKQDTRRKILIGAYWLEQINNDPDKLAKLVAKLDHFLTRNIDRKLFDLPLLTKDAT